MEGSSFYMKIKVLISLLPIKPSSYQTSFILAKVLKSLDTFIRYTQFPKVFHFIAQTILNVNFDFVWEMPIH